VERYRARVSGPLLDRIDALIEVPPLTLAALERTVEGEASALVRDRVGAAREFRLHRENHQDDQARVPLEERNGLTEEARGLLRDALVRDGLSGRAYVRTVRLARTIADLDGVRPVRVDHVAEALALRLDQRRVGLF